MVGPGRFLVRGRSGRLSCGLCTRFRSAVEALVDVVLEHGQQALGEPEHVVVAAAVSKGRPLGASYAQAVTLIAFLLQFPGTSMIFLGRAGSGNGLETLWWLGQHLGQRTPRASSSPRTAVTSWSIATMCGPCAASAFQ